jgi:hypothetical protein
MTNSESTFVSVIAQHPTPDPEKTYLQGKGEQSPTQTVFTQGATFDFNAHLDFFPTSGIPAK